MAEKKNNDEEIGLSEDELNQIMGNDNIFELANQKQEQEKMNLEDVDLSVLEQAEKQSSEPKEGQINTDGLDSLLDEIDLSSNDEGDEISLGLDDEGETVSEVVEENIFSDEDKSDGEAESLNDYDFETIDLSELSLDSTTPEKKSVPEPVSEDKPVRFTISTASPKKTKSKTSKKSSAKSATTTKSTKTSGAKSKATAEKKVSPTKPNKKTTTKSTSKKPVVKKPAPKKVTKPVAKKVVKPITKKVSTTAKSTKAQPKPKLNQRVGLTATVKAPASSLNLVTEVWKDEEALYKLFLHLDEMLASASKEKVKRFALSSEYDLYLAILKKLGI